MFKNGHVFFFSCHPNCLFSLLSQVTPLITTLVGRVRGRFWAGGRISFHFSLITRVESLGLNVTVTTKGSGWGLFVLAISESSFEPLPLFLFLPLSTTVALVSCVCGWGGWKMHAIDATNGFEVVSLAWGAVTYLL